MYREELDKLGVITLESKGTSTSQSSQIRSNIMYQFDTLSNFVTECDWGEYFDRDISDGTD